MWKKQAAFALLICLTVVLLCGCAREQTTYPDAGTMPVAEQRPVRQADVLQTFTDPPEIQIDFPNDYEADPGTDEYDWDAEETEEPEDNAQPSFANYVTSNSQYAGATPIPLDPVDMPTPTPHPDLEFEYQKYETAMGYSFEAPVDWIVDQNDKSAFVIRDPETREKVNAVFTLTSQNVSSSYRANDLKTELSNQLTQIQRNYVGWRIWQADSRKLLKSQGYYNAYRGVTYDDTVVRGLVHVALVDRKVVTLMYSAPGNYNNSYQRVYNRIRNTIE